jgi:methyl-coenzyme M reductase alpha subunit
MVAENFNNEVTAKKHFITAMEVKYGKEWGSNKQADDIQQTTAKYLRLGTEQNPRKMEMAKIGAEIMKKRGLQAYDPLLHLAGIPLGQRQLTPYTLGGTDIVCDGDDLHYVNNAAMQQEWDDIRRTCVVGLDLAHETLEKRLGKEVTPESINYYLEVLNHAMPGGAIVQEHMVETHPAMVDDCYVKVFTGDDALKDELDPQFVIDIDKMFRPDHAAQIKASMGKSSFQAVHIPTVVSRTADGGQTSRWMAMQVGMSFISAYHMCAGEAAVADLAFTCVVGLDLAHETLEKRLGKEVTLGQRQLTPYTLGGTDIVCDGDDLHYVNNAAMQQEWDDIRRTCVVGLDLAHETLEKRLGKEVTPESINYYLEVLNHAMPGGAIVQEHMVETHPAMVDDCYVKVFTGDDALKDELDPQFVIDIDKMFRPDHAAQIKASMGKSSFQAVHIPTVVSRTADGGQTSRWMAMQVGMSFISAYHMCAGEAAVADLAFTAKHAGLIEMSEMLPARRARGPNEPGGLSFGHMCDIVQTSRKFRDDPCKIALETCAAAMMLYDQIWLGGYMSGGVGFTMYATAAYTNNTVDDNLYADTEYGWDTYGTSIGNVKEPTLDIIKDIGTWGALYGLELYENYPTALEDHFGGSQRATVISTATGAACAITTGNSNAGLSAWYLSMYLHKEAHGRLGFFGYDLQDQCGATNVFSYQSDEGLLAEMRGANYPNYAMNVGHQGGYTTVCTGGYTGRGDGFAINPLVKTCFADDLMNFDFVEVRECFGKGALREFDRCAGERAFVIPAK